MIFLGPPEPKMLSICALKHTVLTLSPMSWSSKIILITILNNGDNDGNNNHSPSPNTPTSPHERPSLPLFQSHHGHGSLCDSIMVVVASVVVHQLQRPP